MTLREVLHAHIPTLTRRSTVRDAVDKMDIYQFPVLVIVDDESAPVAVLSEGDLCRAVHDQGSFASLREADVLQFATPHPTCASPGTEVSDAFHLMLSQGITVLPVVEDGMLAGVVYRVDLMQAMMLDSQPEP